MDTKTSRRHPGFRYSCYGLFHALPALLPKFTSQASFRPLPVRLSLPHLSLAGARETKQPLPPVLATFDLNPSLLSQQPQCPGQRRAIHGKARAQQFLIGLPSRSQRGEQAELRDLEACLSQLLVIDPRYHPGEAPQALTRAGQVKQCPRRLFSKCL
jgi:hypothetical protein